MLLTWKTASTALALTALHHYSTSAAPTPSSSSDSHALEKRIFFGVCEGPALNVGSLLDNVLSLVDTIQIPKLELAFPTITDPSEILELDSNGGIVGKATSKGLKVNMRVPGPLTRLNVTFLKVRQVIELEPAGLGRSVASLRMPWTPCSGNLTTKELMVDMEDIDLKVLDEEAFSSFLKQMTLTSGPVNVTFKGKAEVSSRLNRLIPRIPINIGGTFCIGDVAFKKTLPLLGMGGLQGAQITSLPKVISGEADKGIVMMIPIRLNNPSNVKLSAGNVRQRMVYRGLEMGMVYMDGMVLDVGVNDIVARAVFNPVGEEAREAGMELLSRFSQGLDTEVEVWGSEDSSPIKVLGKALAALRLKSTLPGIQQKLIGEYPFFN
ncbi:hypothetical protein HK102_010799 [Quaeritorhiza haematococci]|nr:hypothetical protein HK102_010799 [Quaeritorhiza haematococci]